MTEQDLLILLSQLRSLPNETEWLEFKVNNAFELGEYISALSNSAFIHDKEFGYLVFGIEEKNYSMVSRIISEGIKSGLIKDFDPESNSKKHAKYIPFWA